MTQEKPDVNLERKYPCPRGCKFTAEAEIQVDTHVRDDHGHALACNALSQPGDDWKCDCYLPSRPFLPYFLHPKTDI